jgi:hypothetical protein
MVFTSAPIRPTTLRQRPDLNIGPRRSAPGSELGHLAVRAPDDHGQISATWTCLLTTRSDTDRPTRRPARASSPCCGNGPVALLGGRRPSPAPPGDRRRCRCGRDGAPSGRPRWLSAEKGIACLLPLVDDGREAGRGLLVDLLEGRRRGGIRVAVGVGSRFGRHRPVPGARRGAHLRMLAPAAALRQRCNRRRAAPRCSPAGLHAPPILPCPRSPTSAGQRPAWGTLVPLDERFGLRRAAGKAHRDRPAPAIPRRRHRAHRPRVNPAAAVPPHPSPRAAVLPATAQPALRLHGRRRHPKGSVTGIPTRTMLWPRTPVLPRRRTPRPRIAAQPAVRLLPPARPSSDAVAGERDGLDEAESARSPDWSGRPSPWAAARQGGPAGDPWKEPVPIR